MKKPPLQHIAIIMDGNGRWAQSQGKKRTHGHKEGAKIVRDVTQWCANQKIPYLTLYAFSTEAWNRRSGESRLSNFLLWQSSYAELFFTPTLWPNLCTDELDGILEAFYLKQRRFGALK